MTYADLAIVGTVVLWGLAGLGVYHLAYRGSPTLRKTTPGRTEPRTVKPHRYRDVSDPTDQLDHVMAGKFSKRRLMGYSEYKVFKAVEEEVSLRHRGYRVFAQTSLGQILRSPDPAAHSSINSKRVDVLVIAPNGYPVVVIEYQGTGHFQGKAAARDAVKREALRKAGVEYLEICEFHTPDEARELVRSTLARATTSTSVPRFGRRAEQTSSYLPSSSSSSGTSKPLSVTETRQ